MTRWTIVLTVACVLALGMSGVLWWHQLRQPRIVTVDLAGLADEARSRLHDASKIRAFARQLQEELVRISRDEHLVILPGQAVAAGAPDITERLRRKVLP
ncbi:MAG: TrbI F-type domain-containing protein [Mariprofundaceae bacterium]